MATADQPKPEDKEEKPELTEPNIDSESTHGESSTEETTNTDKPAPKKSMFAFSKKNLVIWISAAMLVMAGSSWAVLYFHKSTPKKTALITKKASTKPLPPSIPIADNALSDKATPIADLHFLADNMKYFSKDCGENQYTADCLKRATELSKDVKYYQLGKTKDGHSILALSIPSDGAGGNTIYFAIEITSGKFEILLQLDPSFSNSERDQQFRDDYIKGLKVDLAPNITLNTTDTINEFSFKKDLKIADQKLTSLYNYAINFMPNGLSDVRGFFYGPAASTPQKIGTDGDKTFYKVIVSDKSTFQVVEIFATYGQLVSMRYFANGEIGSKTSPVATNPEPLKITWSKGENNQNIYFTGGAGCGTSGYVVAKDVDKTQLVSVGKTGGGQSVYQLPDSSALSQELFDKDYAKGEFNENQSLKNLTIQQFMDQHAYFLTLNGFGEYTIFQRDDMFMRGGCAKPVVYLYPTHPTNISVKVGARVVESAPFYPDDNGWQNILAQPNGSLSYRGERYDSLFWEGYGSGAYPDIISGTVVRSTDAVATIRNQLARQGLNDKEIGDFLDYWTPKLPDKPYIRLTWFGTSQLNRLAPLTINPQPRTVIRTFLDFEGLDQPITLPEQHFLPPARKGFTVVEWGGLLREGIN